MTAKDSARTPLQLAVAAMATAATMLVLDLLWLGVVALGMYQHLLGSLMRPKALWPAALMFYAMYVTAIVAYAVVGSGSRTAALRRGAALGFVAYATYELTNWAVIRDWPAILVPIDVIWGVVLTALAALSGKIAETAVSGSAHKTNG